jgi:hypothetical protein
VKCSLLVLSCYLDDELEARRRGELEAHLVACQRCRGGLAHLREEVERIGGLARVHVPDHSTHSLMEITGLLGADDSLPPRRGGTILADPPHDLPPWMAGEAGAALPWSSPRPDRVRRFPDQLSGAEEMESIPDDSTTAGAVTEIDTPGLDDVELEGSAAPRPLPPIDAGGVEALPLDVLALSILSAPSPEPAVEEVPEAIADPPPAPVAEQVVLSADVAPVAEQAVLPGDVPLDAEQSRLPVDASAPATLSGHASPPANPYDIHEIRARNEAGDIPAAPPPLAGPIIRFELDEFNEPHPVISDDTSDAQSPQAGDPAVPVWTSENEVPAAGPTTITEEVLSDPVDDDVPAGPMMAPRAGVFSRIRDHFAMRRALARPPREAQDDSVEIVSGAGAPMRFGRSRSELARRRSEALRPANAAMGTATAIAGSATETDTDTDTGAAEWVPPPPQHTYVGHVTLESNRREPALNAQLAPPARPSSLAPPPAPMTAPPLITPQLPLGDDTPPTWRPREENPLTAMPLTPAQPPLIEASPSELREGRRLLALFGAAAVVLFAVGLASARTSSPIPAPASPTATAPQTGPAVTAPSHSSSSASQQAQPSSPAVNAPPASAQPSGGSQLTNVQVLGQGGTGWQVQGIRYGDHTTYLRTVFDLAASGGATTGSPKVTIGFSDPTTVLVALSGVVPAGSPGSLPSAKFVVSVQQLQPSPISGAITYQFKLARPLTVKALYLSSPTKLVIDFS